jgi:hypothetical protein
VIALKIKDLPKQALIEEEIFCYKNESTQYLTFDDLQSAIKICRS